MYQFYSLLTITCDELESGDDCWGEKVVYLDEGETKAEAVVMLTGMGWVIAPERCICPFCNSGIRELTDSPEIRRIK